MPLDRPNRDELLAAVETLLERAVKPALSGALRYEVSVAIHVLRLVRRELAQGDAFTAREAVLLGEFVENAPEGEHACTLPERIRAGELAFDDARLLAALRVLSLDKLAIDNLRYPSLLDVLERGFTPDD